MAEDIEPKGEITGAFEGRLRDLQRQNQAVRDARQCGSPAPWLVPESEDWTGDLFDLASLGQPFSRDEANEQFVEAMTGSPPGNTGDLASTTTQVNYLSSMERAFRARHSVKGPRAILHAAGRKRGHGAREGEDDRPGLMIQTVLGAVQDLLARSKGAGG